MKLLALALVALLAGGCTSEARTDHVELALERAAGERVQQRLEQRLELALEGRTERHDGKPAPTPDDGHAAVRVSTEQRFEFVDEHVEVRDGAPQVLVRRFGALEGVKRHVRIDEFGEHVDERPQSSLLAHAALRLERDGPGWRAQPLEPLEAHDALVADLDGDCDLAGLLPSAAVAPGDSWPVAPRAALALIHPAGGVELVAEQDPDSAREAQAQLRRNLDGELTATYWGVREREGLRFAVLELRGELRSHAQTAEEQFDVVLVKRFELVRELRCEVLWRIDERRPHAATLEADVVLDSVTRQTRKDELQPHEIEQSARLRGVLRTSASWSSAASEAQRR